MLLMAAASFFVIGCSFYKLLSHWSVWRLTSENGAVRAVWLVEYAASSLVGCCEIGLVDLMYNSDWSVLLPNAVIWLVAMQVAVGNDHVVVVTMERAVYTWGDGSRGQLGHGTTDSLVKPELVEALKGKSITRWTRCIWVDFWYESNKISYINRIELK